MTVHKEADGLWHCEFCDKRFTRAWAAGMHLKRSHPYRVAVDPQKPLERHPGGQGWI